MTDDKLDLDFSKEKAVVNTKDESIKAESKDSKPAATTHKKSHKKETPKPSAHKDSNKNNVDDATEAVIQQKVKEELAKQKAANKPSGTNTKVNFLTNEGEENKSAPAVNPAGLKQKKQTNPFIPEGESNPTAPPAVF